MTTLKVPKKKPPDIGQKDDNKLKEQLLKNAEEKLYKY
jgi:hypothetical protein